MLLEQIHDPSDVRKLNDEQARLLCRELRTFLLEQVSRTGGHLASNLGVVELTVAIHRVFDTSQDRLVLDVYKRQPLHHAAGLHLAAVIREPTVVVLDAVAVIVVLDGGLDGLLRQHGAVELVGGQAAQGVHHLAVGKMCIRDRLDTMDDGTANAEPARAYVKALEESICTCLLYTSSRACSLV